MRLSRLSRSIVAVGVGSVSVLALAAVVLPGGPRRSAPASAIGPRPPRRPPPRSAADIALHRARRHLFHSRAAVIDRLDAIDAWDPNALTYGAEKVRLDVLAQDKGGHLRRARELGYRAERLAATRDELHRALVVQVLAEHALGRHGVELKRATALRDLAPDDPQVRVTYSRAKRCQERWWQP